MKKKSLPNLTSDRAAEAFVESADLGEFDLSALTPHSFEFEPKSKQVNVRFPEALLAAVKARAEAQGMSYQRFIRKTLEAAVRR